MCNIRVLLTFICLLSNNFETLISCVKNVTRVCEDSWRSDEWIDMDVRLKFRKQFYCRNGALILPFVLCGKKYYKKGPQCVRSFHRRFRGTILKGRECSLYLSGVCSALKGHGRGFCGTFELPSRRA